MSELVTSVRQGLEVFFAPGPELVEVRILKTPKKTISGYFDRLELAVEAVEEAVGLYTTNAAFYATLNSVTKAVHARAKNRLKPYADCTSVDADILRRNYLLIDCDPRRPAGVSSTDAELAEALAVREAAMAWLSAHGWPAGLRAMSGNGGHAVYLVDLPNDASTRELFKSCLAALHQRFATPTVEIDRAVYNAARICKIYGTVARKGDATPDRPHRRAEIEERPILKPVTRDQLKWLAGHWSDPRPARSGPASNGVRSRTQAHAGSVRLDMRAEFEQRGWYRRELANAWHGVQCPWIDAHSGVSGDSETAIHEPETADGFWSFKCQHASCTQRTIRDVWALFRPSEASCEDHLPSDPAPESRPALTFTPPRDLLTEPAPVAIVEGVVFKKKLTLLVSESGTGKTFLLLDIAAHVSSGLSWHGRAVCQGSVADVSFEGDALGLRLRALHDVGGHPRSRGRPRAATHSSMLARRRSRANCLIQKADRPMRRPRRVATRRSSVSRIQATHARSSCSRGPGGRIAASLANAPDRTVCVRTDVTSHASAMDRCHRPSRAHLW